MPSKSAGTMTESTLPPKPANPPRQIPLIEIFPNNLYLRYFFEPISKHIFLFIVGLFGSPFLFYSVCVKCSGPESGEYCEKRAHHLLNVYWVVLLLSMVYKEWLMVRGKQYLKEKRGREREQAGELERQIRSQCQAEGDEKEERPETSAV